MAEARWLLLLHQLPRKPAALRLKIWRRLQQLGAVAIKHAVHALPRSEERNEDFQWVIRQIVAGGGDATVVEATFIQGLGDAQIIALFQAARATDYGELAMDARAVLRRAPKGQRRSRSGDEKRRGLSAELKRLRQRLTAIDAIDFFAAPAGSEARALLSELDQRLAASEAPAPRAIAGARYRGRTWVTRKGIFVDRIASGWLIRRFIDPDAKFKFVAPKGYTPRKGELRFDMFEAELTHIGEQCTFEVLIAHAGLTDRGLRRIAEAVHDIDVKDARFASPHAAGLESILAGIALRSGSDQERLARGSVVFDDLYEVFKRKQP